MAWTETTRRLYAWRAARYVRDMTDRDAELSSRSYLRLVDLGDRGQRCSQFTTGLRLLPDRETYKRSITVPTAATPGPARYEVTLDYICNPLQSWIGPIHVVSPPIKFTITPSETTPPKSAGEDG